MTLRPGRTSLTGETRHWIYAVFAFLGLLGKIQRIPPLSRRTLFS